MKKKILLMYISKDSGHHRASLAIEKALHLKANDIETLNVNSFNYTNPVLEKIINKTYMSVIRRKPEVWGYLYDNPKIVKKTQRLRDAIHKHNTEKLKNLLTSFCPDAAVCTQAFPCGMIADYKKTFDLKLPLFGVLTDYAPHSYWVYDRVDAYFVPSKETGQRLINNGVSPNRVIETGIPIDPDFKIAKDRSKIYGKTGLLKDKPAILLTGGSQGVGPLKEIFLSLVKTKTDFQIIAVTGNNRSMFKWFKAQEKKSRKKLITFSYTDNVDELMEIATLLISKPGGITTAEAFAKGLPLCIIKPIPGQEQMNADYLLSNKAAVKIDQPANAGVIIEELLYNQDKLTELNMKAREFSKPDSALEIASFILKQIR